jgi:CelD/BcsL family acetyltransferase involved in cellulose biosynthesis
MLAHTKWHHLPSTRYVAQWTTTARLADQQAAWRRLASQSVDANPFYEPDYLLASARHLDRQDIRCIVIYRDGARDSDMIGLFPLKSFTLPGGMRLPALEFYHNPYVCQTTPLVHRDDPAGVWECFLDCLKRTSNAPRLIHAAQFPSTRQTCISLMEVLARRGLASETVSTFERASIKRLADFDSYVARLSANRRKDLARRERRLAEQGEVGFRLIREESEKALALDTMLTLERSGWKGDSGTALACTPETEQFARAAFLGKSGSIALLTVGGAPIAACACLSSHRTLFTVKIAHDEAYRAFGPGTLLDMKMARTLTSPSAGYRRLDSCSSSGNPVEKYWIDREPISALAFLTTEDASTGWLHGFVAGLRGLDRLKDMMRTMRDRARA